MHAQLHIRLTILLFTTFILFTPQLQCKEIGVSVDLPSQPISARLEQLSILFSTPVVWHSAELFNQTVPPLIGKYTLTQAINNSAVNLGLDIQQSEAGIIVKLLNNVAMRKSGYSEPHKDIERIQIFNYSDSVNLAFQARMKTLERTEIIFADEISKLPEQSVAEVLHRLPGVTITRDAGEGRQASVRGLDSGFTKVSINGLASLATSAAIDSRGAVNNSRRFDLNLIPADLFNQVSVRKSNNAEIDGSIAGTVELSTRSPFDNSRNSKHLAVKYVHTDLASEHGIGINSVYNWHSENEKLGFIVAASHVRYSPIEVGFSTIRWARGDWGDLTLPSRTSDAINSQTIDNLMNSDVFHSRYNRYDIYQRNIERSAAHTGLAWHPHDSINLELDLIVGNMRVNMDEFHLSSVGLAGTDLTDIQLIDAEISNSNLVYAQMNGVDIRSEFNKQRYRTDYIHAQARSSWHIDEQQTIKMSFGLQSADFDKPIHERVYLWAEDQAFSYDYRSSDRIATNTYGFDVNSPHNWRLFRTNKDIDTVDNQYQTAQINYKYRTLDERFNFAFGSAYTHFENRLSSWAITDSSQQGALVNNLMRSIPIPFGGKLPVAGLPNFWQVATADAYQSLHLSENQSSYRPHQQRSYDETNFSLYGQIAWDFDLMSYQWSGNIGNRWEHVAHSSTQRNTSLQVSSTSVPPKHIQWLPSLNIILELSDAIQWRLNLNRNWSMPEILPLQNVIDLHSGAQLIRTGNASLEPIVADSIETALEGKTEDGHLWSLGLFYKSIDGLIFESSSRIRFGDTGLDPALVVQKGHDVNTIYTLHQPVNGDDVDLIGIEFSSVLYLWPELFEQKVGFSTNYTYNHGNNFYQVDEQWQQKPLEGLSRHLGNIIAFADLSNWGMRLTANYRSKYLQAVPSGNGNDEEGVHDSLFVDLSAYWRLSEKLKLSIEANNITDEAFNQYTDSSNRPYTYTKSGRIYSLQLNYSIQ